MDLYIVQKNVVTNMKPNKNSVSVEILKSLEVDIFKLLFVPEKWHTLDVDYFPPRVERLYTNFNDYRIHLHVIHKTNEECLYHKHRWAAAFKQLNGAYEMGITYSPEEISSKEAHNLPDLAKFIITKGSYYEMTQTDCLHYVKPITDTSLSIMITKDLYPEAVFRKEILDKKLNTISENRKEEILNLFRSEFIK